MSNNDTQQEQGGALATQGGSAPAIPEYLKAMMGNQANAAADSMASASMSIPRVSMRGKKFRFIENGEEVAAFNDRVDIVIMGVDPGPGKFIKTYYEKPYAGLQSSDPPDCASDDGIAPGQWVPKRQNPTCGDCPKNKFGSAQSRTGKPAKACRDSKRLWVKQASEVSDPNATVYALQVTVMSLSGLSAYGRYMKDLNVPISAAVTEVTMDDDSEFPKIDFKVKGFLSQEDAMRQIEQANRAPWKLGMVSGPALHAPATGPTAALPGQPAPETGAPAFQTSREVSQQVAAVQPSTAGAQAGGLSATPPQGLPPAGNTAESVGDITKDW